MTNYLLRAIDRKLWKAVQARAEAEDLSVRAVILALLRAYAAGSVAIAATPVEEARAARG